MKTISFIDKVFTFAEENALFSAPCHLLVAVSGGPDSMALLHALQRWPQAGLSLSVVHMNHGLRGKQAERDEQFVRDYCTSHDLPLTVFCEDVSSYATQHKLTVEEAGRVLRYQKFEDLRQTLSADYLLTAHTASDQVETMLMHLLRGCGLDALQGIPAKRAFIRRPLLACNREEVLAFCEREQIAFVLDETNEDTQYTRNRIRHTILPMLREINPSVDAALLRFQHHLSGDVAYLNDCAQALLQQAMVGECVHMDDLMQAPQTIRRRAIRLFLRKQQLKTVSESHVLSVEHIILTGKGKTRLPNNRTAQVQEGILSITRTEERPVHEGLCVQVNDLPFTYSYGGNEYTLSLMNQSELKNVHTLFANHAIDYDTIQGGLTIRTRHTGDTLQPVGRGITKSIKKLMNEWKIATEMRDSYPLLCDDAGVLLVPGYACDQRAAVTEHTKRCLVLHSP